MNSRNISVVLTGELICRYPAGERSLFFIFFWGGGQAKMACLRL